MKRIVLASNNLGKLREIEAIAEGAIELVAQSDFNVPAVDETGLSFVENAILKARHAAHHTGLPALADDSGLEVEALNGAPGIHSARWAGPERDFRIGMKRIWDEVLAKGPEAGRDAHFVCALAVAWPNDGQCENFEGRVYGQLVWPPRGDKGFGYDPMFQPIGHDQTFGEMDPAAKHAMSHRAEAFRKLVADLVP